MRTEVYRREDGLWAWRIRATNGQIIATDGGQGYSRKKDARVMAERFTYSLPVEPTEIVEEIDTETPEIVVLCGSTRFKDAWYAEGKRLTYEGRIVLSVGDLDPRESARTSNVPIDPDLKALLDSLHKQKIRLADRVHVLNVGGYVGASTRSEIAFAEALGRPVTYMEPEATA